MSDHWKSLADLLGAPSLTPSRKPTDPVAEEVHAEPTKEPVAPPAPAPVEAEPIVEATKPKKRSSWEALANLFNIGSGPAPEPPPKPVAPPPPPAPPKAVAPPPKPIEPTPKQTEISLFKPSTAEQNPALVDMFGQASTKPHDSWGKPRKVVDDLGWDDEEPVKRSGKTEDAPVKPTRSLDETAEVDDVEMVDGEPVRRSRRRRSRGGRGRGEAARSNETARPEETSAELRETDKWGSVVGDDASDSDEDDVVISESADIEGPEGEERRPRRRRRRRGRGRGAETSETRQPDDDNLDVESVNRDLLNTDDEDGPSDDVFEGPSADSEGESSDPRRRRRRKRNRGGKRLDDPNQSAELDVDDADDLVAAGQDGEEEGEDGQRHRNIPTWEDSLSTIIEANIENHRRNEGRGGGPRGGGGRHRGGGGGRR